MEPPQQAVLLRIFIRTSDTWHHESLYLALIEAARDQGLGGATVLRGVAGFGANGRINTTRIVDISPELPIVVEIVDDEDKIQAFLPTAEAMMQAGLITWERVNVVFHRGGLSPSEREQCD
jgi:PII-like signaling protein